MEITVLRYNDIAVPTWLALSDAVSERRDDLDCNQYQTSVIFASDIPDVNYEVMICELKYMISKGARYQSDR